MSTGEFLDTQLAKVSSDEFVVDVTFFAEVRNLLDMHARLKEALRRIAERAHAGEVAGGDDAVRACTEIDVMACQAVLNGGDDDV